MSGVKRYASAYENGTAIPAKDGDYVLYSDYAALEEQAHNLRSPVHAICNQNLTEALAAAIEQTQAINRLKAPVSDDEWRGYAGYPSFRNDEYLLSRDSFDAIIANRAKAEKP